MYLSLKHFRYFLEGRSFTIYTDHKPLTFALASSTERSPRQTRHLSYVAEFTSDIRHVKGSANVVADALSRPLCPAVSAVTLPEVNLRALAAAQDHRDADGTSLLLQDIDFNGVRLLCDSSAGFYRPIVPVSFRREIFESLHSLSHPGPRPTTKLISSRYVWRDMRRDIKRWCGECTACQTSKVSRHIKAPVTIFPPAIRRFGSCLLYTSPSPRD